MFFFLFSKYALQIDSNVLQFSPINNDRIFGQFYVDSYNNNSNNKNNDNNDPNNHGNLENNNNNDKMTAETQKMNCMTNKK
jgi:hypothetical protein